MSTHPYVGIDLGYGQVKIAGPGFRALFPAVVADASVDADALTTLRINGRRYLVGEGALADPSHRYTARMDKIREDDELVRYCAALAHAADHYDTDVINVCTGLPPAHWRDSHWRQLVIERLTGVFHFTCKGREYMIEVPEVTVDPQAGAAFFDHLLHDDGDLACRDLLSMQTLVVDIGHNTTDVAMFKGRKAAFGRDSLKTIPKGVWHVYEEAQRVLQREYRLPLLSAAAVDPIWRQGGLKLAGRWTDTNHLKAVAAEPIAKAILSDIERTASDLRLWDAVLLTGGGAQVLGPYLNFPVPVIESRDGAHGNAAGYFKRRFEQLRIGG